MDTTSVGCGAALVNHVQQQFTCSQLQDRVRDKSSWDVRWKKNPSFFFFSLLTCQTNRHNQTCFSMNTGLHTLNSSKEHHKTTELVLSLAGLYKHWHRQKITGLMQEGKNKHTQFYKGHVLLHYVIPWSAIPFRVILKDIPFPPW